MLQQYISPETDVILPRSSHKQPSSSILLSGVVNSANMYCSYTHPARIFTYPVRIVLKQCSSLWNDTR